MNYLYHWLMEKYCGWRLRRYVKQLRATSNEDNPLPSLDPYSDEAIITAIQRNKTEDH